jgi:hypothetical protein
MNTYEEVDVQIHVFLISALDGSERWASRPSRFTPGETAPRYTLYRRLGGPQNDVQRRQIRLLQELELRPLCRPLRSESLYRLSYPGSAIFKTHSLYSLDVPLIYSSTFCSVYACANAWYSMYGTEKHVLITALNPGIRQDAVCLGHCYLFAVFVIGTSPFLCLHALVLWNHRRHQ